MSMSQTMIVSSDDDDGKILQDSGVDSGVVTDDGETRVNKVKTDQSFYALSSLQTCLSQILSICQTQPKYICQTQPKYICLN